MPTSPGFLQKSDAEATRDSILVVEDNLVNQKVMLVLLDLFSLEAEVVNDGQEAVDAVKNKSYSVILMDCHMPIMDGFQAAVEIRKYEKDIGQYTPIIAVTALAMAGDRERCIAAGMDDYISKPIDREILRNKISHWMRSDIVMQSQSHRRNFVRSNSALKVVDSLAPIDVQKLEEIYKPADLRRLLDLFVNTSNILLGRIQESIDSKDRRIVTGMAHELKSSSSSIGSKKMSRLCLCLEQAAGQEDWLEANETYQALVDAFQGVKDYITEFDLEESTNSPA